jgi:hypothetical protein
MVDPEIVRQIRALASLGWGAKRIAREVGVARNSVRRYLRDGTDAETQTRPAVEDADVRTGFTVHRDARSDRARPWTEEAASPGDAHDPGVCIESCLIATRLGGGAPPFDGLRL